MGDNLSVPGLKRPATTMNDFTSIDIIVPRRKTPNRKETVDSFKSKLRSSKTIRRQHKNNSQLSKTDNFLFLDRKFCFNESKLKKILSRFHLPIDHNSLRIMKEHAKD